MKIEHELIDSIEQPQSAPAIKFLELVQNKSDKIQLLAFAELINARVFATFKVGEDSKGNIEALMIMEPGKDGLSISTAHTYLSLNGEGQIDCNVDGVTIDESFPFETDQETFFGLLTLNDYKDLSFEHIELFRELIIINNKVSEEFAIE